MRSMAVRESNTFLITISFVYFLNIMFYTKQELLDIGFIQVGDDTRVSKKSVFHGIKEGVIETAFALTIFLL